MNSGDSRQLRAVPNIELLRLDELRSGIRANRISFPAQVPVFEKHDRPDLQRKLVQLYFVFGWSCTNIAIRYGLLRQRVQQILNTWKRRAAETGYVQHIPPEQDLTAALVVRMPTPGPRPAPQLTAFVPPVAVPVELPRNLQ